MADREARPVIPAVESYNAEDVEAAFDFLGRLDPRVRDLAVHDFVMHLFSLEESMTKRCESPIEQLLWFSLSELAAMETGVMALFGKFGSVSFRSQAEVKTPKGTYRLDFLVTWVEDGNTYCVGVECDGHDFHEKTKQQAAHDKQRDRALVAAGYTMLHFTGAEIWRDPEACTNEVSRVLNQLVRPSR